MKYKIKIDRATAEHTRAVISFCLGDSSRTDPLFRAMLHDQLLTFADSLHNPWAKKTKAFNVSGSLAYALAVAAVHCATRGVSEASCAVVNQYVLQPILKQVNEGK